MVTRRPTGLYILAAAQFLALLILPPSVLSSMSFVLLGIGIVVFAFLGISLVRLRPWARVATVFVQGMNMVIRLLVWVSHATINAEPGAGFDFWMAGTTILALICSWYIIRYVDQPEIQALMQ